MDKSNLNNIPALKAALKALDIEFLHGVPVHLTEEAADQIIKLFQEHLPEKITAEQIQIPCPDNKPGCLVMHYGYKLSPEDAAHNNVIDKITSILTNNGGAE